MQTSGRSRALKWLVVVLVLGGLSAATFAYVKRPKNLAPEYKTGPVERGDIVQVVTANGSLNPVRNVEVGSQISGTLLDVRVDFNSKVKAGDVIAQIDPATYERALLQADAEVANADASLELARLNFDRAKELHRDNLIAKSEFDQTKASLSQAEATVKMRQANLERAKVDLSRTTIYAPIDGVVITRKVEIGQTVAASLNTPTLFVIANDLAKMQIEAAVSEADVGGVVEGQKVDFTVEAFPLQKFQGTIRQVRFAPTTNQNVVTYATIVDVDNRELRLRPGMTANASIITAESRGAVRIPNSALRFRAPAGAVVQGETNALAAGQSGPKVEIATSGPFAGLPVPPWAAGSERRRPRDDERAAYEASLTPEQKQKYQQVMSEMRARFAQRSGSGEGGGGPGGEMDRPRRSEPTGQRSQTVYLLEKESTPAGGERSVLKPVTVRLGISDGTYTEVLEGLKEGDILVTGAVTQVAAAQQPTTSPFGGGPFGGPPRVRGAGGR